MRWGMFRVDRRLFSPLALATLIGVAATPVVGADNLYGKYFANPAGGKPCYLRSYDAAHLKKHPRQRVTAMEMDFDISFGDTDRPNSAAYFEAQLGFRLRHEKENFGDAIYCKTLKGYFDCYFDADGGTFRLVPQGETLRVEIMRGGGGTDEIQIEGQNGFVSFGAPGSDDRVFVLPPASRKSCEAWNSQR